MELEYSLRGLLVAFFRQQYKFAAVFFVVVGIGAFYLASMDPVYEAHGSMLVKFGQDARPSVNVGGGAHSNEVTSSDREEIIRSNVSIIYSQDLLRSVVAEYGATRLYADLSEKVPSGETPESAAVSNLQKGGLKAEAGARNNVIDVTITNKNPAVAAEFATLLMERFALRQAEIYNKPETGFLHQQVTEASVKLGAAQKEFQSFKQQTGISSLADEVEQLMRQKTDLSGIAFEAVTRAQADLAALEAKRAEMVATYRADSPAVRRVDKSIASARQQLNSRQAELNNVAGQSADTSLGGKLQSIDARLDFLEDKRPRYTELEQQVDMAQENLKYYQQRGEEARANDILNQQNITRISVIDTPVVPSKPASRHRKLLLLAFLMTGGLMGLAAVLGLELLDDRFRTPEQVASRLGVPVLSTFSFKKGV